jgi:hypothetical protein
MNYVIGYENKGGSVSAYMLHNAEVHHGQLNDAKAALTYIQARKPDRKWKLYELVEVKDGNKKEKERSANTDTNVAEG